MSFERVPLRRRLLELHPRPAVAWGVLLTAFLGLAVLHLFVNGAGISHRELWGDEASTSLVADYPIWRVLTLPVEYHSQPPLYYVLLHYLQLFDGREWVIRGMSWAFTLGLLAFVVFGLDELNLPARLAFALLFIFNGEYTHYMAQELRPYALAALSTLVCTVLLTRLFGRLDDRRLARWYCVSLVVMLYTLAFDAWVIAAHGSVALLVVLRRARVTGLGAAVREHWRLLRSLAVASILYVPYLVLVIRHAPHEDRPAGLFLQRLTTRSYYEDILRGFMGAAWPWWYLMMGVILVGLLAERRRRNPFVLLAPVLIVGQVAFVYTFLVAHPQTRYVLPAFPVFLLAVAAGVHHLVQRQQRLALPVLAVLAALTFEAYPAYASSRKAPVPRLNWRRLYDELGRFGTKKKGLFFNNGGYGQMLGYVARADPTYLFLDDGYEYIPGTGLCAGGLGMTAAYLKASVKEHRADVDCFFFSDDRRGGPSRYPLFQAEMAAIGYKDAFHSTSGAVPDVYHDWFEVHGFCRP